MDLPKKGELVKVGFERTWVPLKNFPPATTMVPPNKNYINEVKELGQ